MKKYLTSLITISFTILLFFTSNLNAQNIKVFILAGQSNMQGHGNVGPENISGTLSHFISSSASSDFAYIRNNDGSWATRDDVWVRYDHENGELLADELNIGFGGDDMQIGPELGFGHLLGQHLNEQVLIIKTCWGGKSLAVDFRPPSSGGATGPFYQQMMADITSAINNISTEFPQYQGGQVEIAGFTWFQGWNDGEQQSYLDEYEQNLINLISDVRTDLNVPDLPVVIGLTGNGGRDIEAGDGWINGLQTQLVPAQIRAVESNNLTNVAIAETRDFWRDSEVSPEPEFLHHWNNNAESYLRIGTSFGIKMIELINAAASSSSSSASLGTVQPNTNLALPASYNFQEYVFAEPNDQGTCLGNVNNTAVIEEVYMAQTHRHAIDHPLFFTIGHRPAVLQLAVTGSGAAPDVTVEGRINGVMQGTLCLNGPSTLSQSIDLARPNFDDYFSVTLPKSWIIDGLELTVRAGPTLQIISSTELKIGPYTEMNLVEVMMDLLDYNIIPAQQNKIIDLLAEVASAIPASVIRYGTLPAKIKFPTFAVTDGTAQMVTVTSIENFEQQNIPGLDHLNSVANTYLENIQKALGDQISTVYFGNTLNLNPGGWGGDRSFVAADYDGVFIHELGHALSLPHWGEAYGVPIEDEFSVLYPYGGELNEEGGGIGETWTFIQDKYAFVNPKCEITTEGNEGKERSDCMQREVTCNEMRGDVEGPWEGFSDFSAYRMHQFLAGGNVINNQVPYRAGMANFQIPEQSGYPVATLENGKRVFTRDPAQPQDTEPEDTYTLPGEDQIEQDIYLLYGSIHPTQDQVNILYEPIKMKSNLVPIIDPTDPVTFNTLQSLTEQNRGALFNETRDITIKLSYIDGTVSHVLVPFKSFDRGENIDYFGYWRTDIAYFSVAVPADVDLCSVEMYQRSFFIGFEEDDREGNINHAPHNITAANFMEAAVLKGRYDYSCNCPGTPGYIEPGTPCDDGNPLTVNDVEDGSCNCAGTVLPPCGVINNGHFDESLFAWWTWGATATSQNGVATFENVDPSDSGIAQGPFSISQNENYTISFEASANANRTIELIVSLGEEPYTDYFLQVIELSTENQLFTLPFTMLQASTTKAEIEFFFGGDDESVRLDNICLQLDCGVGEDCNPPCVPNINMTGVVLSGTYHAADTATSDGQINLSSGGAVSLKAGECISLEPGFIVKEFATFEALIETCAPRQQNELKGSAHLLRRQLRRHQTSPISLCNMSCRNHHKNKK